MIDIYSTEPPDDCVIRDIRCRIDSLNSQISDAEQRCAAIEADLARQRKHISNAARERDLFQIALNKLQEDWNG